MQINDQIVERVAFLAKLSFEDKEKKAMQKDLNNILDMCEKLNEVNTKNVEPLVFMTEETNPFRDDDPSVVITKKEALKNAPEKDSDYFKVPKVFDR